jgi:D-alanine transaminase
MTRIVYVNGRYRPYAEAAIHAEDRGFQFADSVYEVCEVRCGRLVDERRHMDRLERSLGAIGMAPPMSRGALAHVLRQVVRKNRVADGSVYLQVSRGAAPRDFAFPAGDVPPTVVCLARRGHPQRQRETAGQGIAVVTLPDIRWRRSDIKSVMLLPACLAKDEARRRGAREAWLVDADGFVTEGASSNAWIVTEAGEIVTRALSAALLAGVTRATAADVIRTEGLPFVERAFTVAEALAAREAFITSASNTVMPVVRIDGRAVADGRPGPVVLRLRERFHAVAEISSP